MTTRHADLGTAEVLCGERQLCARPYLHAGDHESFGGYVWPADPGPFASLAYDDSGDMVPGWHDSPQGRADDADQARWDRQETRTNG